MNYIRLLVTAEGPTEQKFARKVLADYLIQFGVLVSSRSVLTSRDKRASREYRGGLKSYQQAKKDIETRNT